MTEQVSPFIDSYARHLDAICEAIDASDTGKIRFERSDKYSEAILYDMAAENQIIFKPVCSKSWEITALHALWEYICE